MSFHNTAVTYEPNIIHLGSGIRP